MRKLFLLLLVLPAAVRAQIPWKNYSTSFQGNGKEGSRPTLVTAIPYNGMYDGSSYHSIPAGDQFYIGESETIDSNAVYFLAPGVHPANATQYEYRVLLDRTTIVLPWSPITRFTAPGIALNEFKPDFGFLGGYKAPWGHSILVDLREKASGVILSSALVNWTPTHPHLLGVYTISDLPNFIGNKSDYWDWKPDSVTRQRLATLAAGKLVVQPRDNTLIFYVGADIYQRTALEYQLLRDGSIYRPWKANDFDNDMIFLQDLPHGNYTLNIRLRAQRHNPSSYSFTVKANWYDTKIFYVLLGFLTVASIIGVIAFVTLIRQRSKTRREQATREKLNLELRSIRSQLNPHFVFNALSSIQGLINKQDTEAANRYLSEFGSLLRESLATSDKDYTELAQEIAILDTYLKLEQLRFGFNYAIETAPDVTSTATDIPAFLLQPIVENAVKHGVSGLREQGRVRLRFYREKANFIAEVSDNGGTWDTVTTRLGYGLTLTRERIRLLNQLLKSPVIEMTIVSDGPDAASQGTKVSIRFSNWWT